MKLFSLRLTTLKSKLYAIILTSVITRVLLQLFLPYEPTNLAPDEGNYAHLANWISLEKPADLYPNYGNLYRTTKAFILPAAFLDKAGIPQLLSVRVISGLYSILTTILVANLVTRFINESKHLSDYRKSYSRIAIAIFFIFTFWPSRFIWSVFGMRESAVEFWVILTYFVFTLIFQPDRRRKFLLVTMLVACVLMVYFSRPQVGLVMSFSLIIAAVIHLKLMIAKIVIPVLILTAFLGDSATSLEEKVVPTTNSIIGTGNTTGIKQAVTSGLKEQADSILKHQDNNKLTAASAIPDPFCPADESIENHRYVCLLLSIPSKTFTFVFRPLAPWDATSVASLFAMVENLFLFIIFIYISIRIFLVKRLDYFQTLSPLLIFMATYCVAAGVYEGNMGTGFRHKSLIFWIVFLVFSSTILTNKKNRI
jgi:hypothetical protein